jgi:hypothetical protein
MELSRLEHNRDGPDPAVHPAAMRVVTGEGKGGVSHRRGKGEVSHRRERLAARERGRPDAPRASDEEEDEEERAAGGPGPGLPGREPSIRSGRGALINRMMQCSVSGHVC